MRRHLHYHGLPAVPAEQFKPHGRYLGVRLAGDGTNREEIHARIQAAQKAYARNRGAFHARSLPDAFKRQAPPQRDDAVDEIKDLHGKTMILIQLIEKTDPTQINTIDLIKKQVMDAKKVGATPQEGQAQTT